MPDNVIQIPLLCPKCYGKLVAVKYVVSLRVLKERCWHICKSCGFERDVEDFKRNLFSI
ncbi:MAG TPA: hypothetical protein VNK25_02285 [Candidatus Nitrosotenuis sp.]|nr:hypothetical protein [Candidatus Nitrosotenuis sp.]